MAKRSPQPTPTQPTLKRPVMPTKTPPPASDNSGPPQEFKIVRGRGSRVHKVVLYGPGGVGKTELASLIDDVGIAPVFIDLEEGSSFLDVARAEPTPQTFMETIQSVNMLANNQLCNAIVIDSLTKAEELAVAHTLQTVKHEKGHEVNSIEGYGWGKGYIYVYETFMLLLQALDAAARKGKHIVCTCHDCTASVPNPGGDDWIRYEPRLQSPPSGKGSIRHRVKEWCDHLVYVGFDVFVSEGGKAQGSGSRSIYLTEMPTHWAKSRSMSETIVYEQGEASLWESLITSTEGNE